MLSRQPLAAAYMRAALWDLLCAHLQAAVSCAEACAAGVCSVAADGCPPSPLPCKRPAHQHAGRAHHSERNAGMHIHTNLREK